MFLILPYVVLTEYDFSLDVHLKILAHFERILG